MAILPNNDKCVLIMGYTNFVPGVVDAREHKPVCRETDASLLAQGYKYYSPSLDENLYEVEVIHTER